MDHYVPPFQLTPKILDLCTQIAALTGRFEGLNLPAPQIRLRKTNQIKTIHGTTAIEGNTLSIEQITAIIEGKRVIGSEKEIKEVKNAIEAYSKIKTFTRKEYIGLFKIISTATASRDLKSGVESGQLARAGDKRNASYSFM